MKLSVKYKLVILLLIVSVGSLFFYSFMAINLFVKDKKKYIYDSSEIIAKSMAKQVRTELNSFEKIAEPIVKSVDVSRFHFTKLSNDYFVRQNRIEHMFIYLPTTGSSFQEMDHLYLPKRSVKKFAPGGEVLEEILKQSMEKGFAIQEVKTNKRYFAIARKYNSPSAKRDYVVLSVFASPDLYETFAQPSAYKNYLLSKNHFMSMEPKYKRKRENSIEIASVEFFDPIFKNNFPTGVAEIPNYSKKIMLVSFSRVGISDLIVASVVEKDQAMKVVEEFQYKTLFFIFNIVSLSLLIGLVASQGLISALREMSRSLKSIQEGNFDVFVNINSSDEVKKLADQVNAMAKSLKDATSDSNSANNDNS
ncbi:MAG: HAMP domain-containing protein [Bdellovibrionales bacterium]|nr:HAMP domain-containing protein [Bdellovibrionales bacterium]